MGSFIIPKDFGNIFRLAMIPEFPSLFGNNPGDGFQAEYPSEDFYVHVHIATDKESYDEEVPLSFEELKFIDSRFQQSIGNWLMDKKARLGNDEITGNLDTLAKDIYGRYQIRSKDKEILLVNLKSLSIFTYNVWYKSENKEKDFYFRLIDSLEYDEENRNFVVILAENVVGDGLVLQVVSENHGEAPGPYISKTQQDIYPKQDRYAFNMRQYLATIKNYKLPIPRTKGDYLLEQFGYLSHCKQYNQKYRNLDAEIMIEHDYEMMAKNDYGVLIEKHTDNIKIKKVKNRFYITTPKNAVNAKLPRALMNVYIKRLAKLIKETGGQTYDHEIMYTNLAKQILGQYGFKEVKKAYDANWSARAKFTFKDLKAILNLSSKA